LRRLVLTLVVLVGLLALADRAGAFAAQRVVAERIQQDESLAVRPTVSITGFPFLTQLVEGHYNRVDVSVSHLRRGLLTISRVVAHLSDVDVPFSAVVHQHVKRITVSRATAEVDLDFSDINAMLGSKHLRMSPGREGRVHVAASVSVGSTGVHVDGDFPLTVQGSSLMVALPGGQSVQVPLPSLPFGIRLQSAKADSAGIVVLCSTSTFVIRP
jgi:hypothetical protein